MAGETVKPDQTADLLHSAAIRLLRRLRTSDTMAGLSAAQASALSVLVFGGPQTIGQLAAAEQVRLPTMSRLVKEMERTRLITRAHDEQDGRISRLTPTAKGKTLFAKARDLRLARLQKALEARSAAERKQLFQAARLIVALARDLD